MPPSSSRSAARLRAESAVISAGRASGVMRSTSAVSVMRLGASALSGAITSEARMSRLMRRNFSRGVAMRWLSGQTAMTWFGR